MRCCAALGDQQVWGISPALGGPSAQSGHTAESGGGGRRLGNGLGGGWWGALRWMGWAGTHLPALLRSARVAPSCRRSPGGLWGGAWMAEEGLQGRGARKGGERGAQVAVGLLQPPPSVRIRGVQPYSAVEEFGAHCAASAGFAFQSRPNRFSLKHESVPGKLLSPNLLGLEAAYRRKRFVELVARNLGSCRRVS